MIETLLFATNLLASGPTWTHARALMFAPLRTPGFIRVTLPQRIDPGVHGMFRDVRIVDAQNHPVPFAFDARTNTATAARARIFDLGFVRGRYTQLFADLGNTGELHGILRIASPRRTFFERVEIATSNDLRTWSVVRSRALIYRVAQNDYPGHRLFTDGHQSITYGPSRTRYVRLRILDGGRAFPVTGIAVPSQPPVRTLRRLASTQRTFSHGSQTLATLRFAAPHTQVTALVFETSTPTFSRMVTLRSAGEVIATEPARIARFALGGPALTLSLAPIRLASLDVAIANGSDAPLAGLRVTALGPAHSLVFPARPGQRYRLLWGASAARAPHYDLAAQLAHERWKVVANAQLGRKAPTTLVDARAAIPSASARLRSLALPVALMLALLALAITAIRALRRPPAS